MGIVLTPAQNPFHNTGTIVSADFGVYGTNDPFTVTNTGLIWGQGSYGVQLRDGRKVVNGSAAATASTIRGGINGVEIDAVNRATQYNGPGTVTNYGTILGGGYSGVVFSDAGGTVTNGAAGVTGAQIYGATNGVTFRNGTTAFPAAVTNFGTIRGHFTGIGLQSGGTVVNQSAAGYIYGGNVGVGGAFAREETVTNLGTIAGPGQFGISFIFGADGSVINGSVGATKSLITGGQTGVLVQTAGGTLAGVGTVTNAGTILGGGYGIALYNGGTVTNMAVGGTQGLIEATGIPSKYSSNSDSRGILIQGAPGTVSNLGIVEGHHAGVELRGGGTITNGPQRGMAASITGDTDGILIDNAAATITNLGTITGSDTAGILFDDVAGSVINGAAGVLGARIAGGATGIAFGTGPGPGTVPGQPGAITNFGTIRGIFTGTALQDGGSLVNQSAGGVPGYIYGGNVGAEAAYGPATITNFGTIAGPGQFGVLFFLGAGGSVTNGDVGATNALITGGQTGVDFQRTNGSAAGVGTVTNAGTILGGTYGVELDGGGSVTNGASGVIAGTGSLGEGIFGLGNPGQNPVVVVNAGTITGQGVGISLSSGTVANSGTITGAAGQAVRMGGTSNLVVFYPGAVFNGVVIGGSALSIGNVLELASSASTGSIGGIGGIGTQYTEFGRVIVDAGAAWTLTGANTIAPGGLLSVYGALSNAGSLQGNAVVEGGGSLTNRATASISSTVYGVGGAGSFTNLGTSGGVQFQAGGSVVNGSASATIGGANDGVYIGGGTGTVTNLGTITGLAVAGVLLNAGGGVTNGSAAAPAATITGWSGVALYAGGTVTNLGAITGTGFAGIDLVQGGNVSNNKSGAVAGTVRGNLFGVAIEAGTATIVNAGSITGATGIGFYPGASGTVNTSGTIKGTGGTAIDFGAGGGNLLKVFPGAVFQGNVTGAGGNTLELAKSAATGAISGLGTSFAGFGLLQVDTTATWRIGGANTVAHALNNGTLTLMNGAALDVTTAVDPGDTGLYQLNLNSDLEIASILGTNTQMKFLGSAQITADHVASFGTNVGTSAYAGPLIEQFVAGDKVDLADLTVGGASLSYTAATGLLQIANAASQHATLLFQNASLGAGTFHAANDGTGHTLITHS
jgi:hypothetical protein